MEKSLMIVTEAFELGGVGTYIRCEVEELIRQGWRVHLVCGRHFAPDFFPEGLSSLTTGLALGPEASIHEFLETVEEIVEIARRERVSAIDAHPFTSLIPALVCASTLRIPCIATLHGPSSVAGSYGSAYDFILASLVLPAVSEVSAVSEEVAALASPYVEAHRLSILPNTVGLPALRAQHEPPSSLRWLTVSRLDSAKVEGLIQFARLAAEVGLEGLDVCGDGPARQRLEEALADMIESGYVRLLGATNDVAAQMGAYSGVAGMGRVALEGLVAGLQVVLVGYDGVKGLIDEALYVRATRTNLSGRGLPNIDSGLLAEQLAQRALDAGAAVTARVRGERGAGIVWAAFADRVQQLMPVHSGIVDAYMEQLRAMHPRSHSSAYWSREIMEVMARVMASPLVASTHLAQSFTIHSEAFTRSIIEQQGSATRDLVRQESSLMRVERAMEAMESTIRQDLVQITNSMNVHAEMNKEIIELNERIQVLEQELAKVYGSSSWVLMRPARVLRRLLLEPRVTWRLIREATWGEKYMDAAGSAQPRRSNRFVHAWNFIRRTVRTGRIDPSDKARLLGMVHTNYVAVAERLGVEIERPMLAEAQLDDVFVWSVIDWHFRMQRPQHLSAAMARKGHRVFYISNNFLDSVTPGFAVEALDKEGRLFQVNLYVAGAPQIYFDVASTDQVTAIQASLAILLEWTSTTGSISLVQHPFWLEPSQSLPNMRLVYDCMDHHGGFEDNAASVLAGERTLVESANLLIVTSQWLYDEMEGKPSNIAMIRNATEYTHFCDRPTEVFADPEGRRIIGYYGAIAEWFDVDLIRKVAEDHPRDLVLLVGRDTAGAQQKLDSLSNVRFTGEVSYRELPYWVHAFDVCLLPFKVIPLTLATNPVKVYEYLSAGKPTVSVDLPEMSQFDGLVYLAAEPDAFSRAVSLALQPTAMAAENVEARQAFARQQTWAHRAADLDSALASIVEPKVSVIVLCYNNLAFTQACLQSLDMYSDYPNLEIIAVDNASSDGSVEYLREWEAGADNRVFIANADNLGFSAGNNVGLRAATGEYLVVLNNDTYVTPGWIRGMVRHLQRNPIAGLVGPVTNNIGNEARIEIHYASMEEMVEKAGEYTRRHPGQSFGMETAAFFCVMITRLAYETVGPMDEDFGIGFFEDDDYCRRLALNGFTVLCADDVFVHHHLSASFNQLKADTKQILFEKNKKIYEAKWGSWVPHAYRDRNAC